MARALVLDMTRLWLASLRPTPRGIERVEVSIARQLTEDWQGDVFGLSWTPWGVRLFDRAMLDRLIAHINMVWREQGAATDDPVFRHLKAWMAGRQTFQPALVIPTWRHQLRKTRLALRALRATGVEPGVGSSAIPQGAVFAVLGHVGLVAPGVQQLVTARPDLKLAALIHDAVSLSDPQFFRDRNQTYFQGVLDRAFTRGDIILTTTDHVRGQLEALRPDGPRGSRPRIRTVDISATFRDLPEPVRDAELAETPYFLICGTREPRKNHMILLNLWRDMARAGGMIPKLVMAGGHGWGSELVDVTLARSDALRGHVAHVETLSSPGLFHLMMQARALLSPSFAEGYGLPVEEALSLGTPVIASDIPVYAETTRGAARLIDPLDGLGWRKEIVRSAHAPTLAETEKQAAASRFKSGAARHASVAASLADA